MGKTGSVNWAQVKGVRGQIRLVPERLAKVKKPGPNQRYKRFSTLRRLEKSESQRSQMRGRRGGRHAGGSDPRVRRWIYRSKRSALGVKKR
ncbi:MAG: DUF5350 domain-containing protein [Methanoculleaceae archaeon]